MGCGENRSTSGANLLKSPDVTLLCILNIRAWFSCTSFNCSGSRFFCVSAQSIIAFQNVYKTSQWSHTIIYGKATAMTPTTPIIITMGLWSIPMTSNDCLGAKYSFLYLG